MKRRSPFYKKLAVLLGIAVFCIALAHITARFTGGIVINELLAPVQSGVMQVWHKASTVLDGIGASRQLSSENKKLIEQVEQLSQENTRLREYLYENQRLLGLLDFKERYADHFNLMGARVISRAPNTLSNIVVIDRGSQDGVKKHMVAVSSAGLVGQVIAVGPNTSQVLLILDREGAAAALVQDTRTPGVVEGTSDDIGLLRMVSLPYDARPVEGQVVITSGMGGIFPPGLPIGKITKIEDTGVNKHNIVDPFVDFDRLEELFLITEVLEPIDVFDDTENLESTEEAD